MNEKKWTKQFTELKFSFVVVVVVVLAVSEINGPVRFPSTALNFGMFTRKWSNSGFHFIIWLFVQHLLDRNCPSSNKENKPCACNILITKFEYMYAYDIVLMNVCIGQEKLKPRTLH